MADSKARLRITDQEGPLFVTGRTAKTKQVGDATLIASGALPETVIRHLHYDEHGNLTARYVRRIRRVAQ